MCTEKLDSCLFKFKEHDYRPQTKFAKVMFSQVSVCPQGRGCLPHCMLGYTLSPPPGQNPLCPVHAGIHPPPSACWDTHLHMTCECWDTHTPCAVHAGPWSTSGRYAYPLECIRVFVFFSFSSFKICLSIRH